MTTESAAKIVFSRALNLHRNGNLGEAELKYRETIELQTDHADAIHNLGIILIKTHRKSEAIELFRRAITISNKQPQYWRSLLGSLIALERFSEAEAVLEKLEILELKIKDLTSFKQSIENNRIKSFATRGKLGNYEQTVSELFQLFETAQYRELKERSSAALRIFSGSPQLLNLLGLACFNLGEFQLAVIHFQKLITIDPSVTGIQKNLAYSQVQSGMLNDAVTSFEEAIKENYDDFHVWYQLGDTYYRLQRFSESLNCFETAITINPRFVEAYNGLALLHFTNGKLTEAKKFAGAALSVKSDDIDAHLTFGNISVEEKDYFTAIAYFKEALALEASSQHAAFNLALVYEKVGDIKSAIEAYQLAIKINSKFFEARFNLAILFQKIKQFDLSEKHYLEIIRQNPNCSDAYNNLGNIKLENGLYEEASELYDRCLEYAPDHVLAISNKCEIYEQTNQIAALNDLLRSYRSKAKVISDEIQFYEMLLNVRENNFYEAQKILKTLNIKNLNPKRKIKAYEIIGKMHDKLGNFETAFESFDKMNSEVKTSDDYKLTSPDRYLKKQIAKVNILRGMTFKKNKVPRSHKKRNDQKINDPVFLIGFPRSGTTLLDTILRTHSHVCVSEEQPAIDMVEKFLSEKSKCNFLDTFPRDDLGEAARKIYFAQLHKHIGFYEKPILIDKYPLNIFQLHLISYVFTNPRFIVVLRNPMDVLFSNWMQNYAMNDAMANMTDLSRIADLYDLSMSNLSLSSERFNFNIHFLKYENLIGDFRNEIKSLLQFLGLEWEESVLNYVSTAKQRRKINTPSYSQVIKPIYNDASGRWLNYEARLSQYRSTLEKWITKYEYTGMSSSV